MEEKKKVTKFEQIEKKNIFSTPEGYFDRLPAQIQSRIKEKESIVSWPVFIGSLKYAIPAVLIIMGVIIWQNQSADILIDPDQLVAEVSDNDILDYLEQNEVTTEEFVSYVDVSDEVFYQILEEETDLLDLTEEELLLEDWESSDLFNDELI